MFRFILDLVKARRAEERDDMTDFNFYANDEDDEVYFDHAAPEDPAVEETSDKPEVEAGSTLGPYHRIRQGPAVAYVNSIFGVDGDRYTTETVLAVKRHQRDNGLRVTGVVNSDLYNEL